MSVDELDDLSRQRYLDLAVLRDDAPVSDTALAILWGCAPLDAIELSDRLINMALRKNHPDYYFLIDRDHHSDQFVNECWSNFSDPTKCNLLVWRMKEIENYFLDANYLSKSQYCRVTPIALEREIINCAQCRIYLDIANYVITFIRETQKANWIELFTDPSKLHTGQAALTQLLTCPELATRKRNIAVSVRQTTVRKLFDKMSIEALGSGNGLRLGSGSWLHLVRGKKILPSIVNRCFEVRDRDNKPLTGNAKLLAVVRDLAQLPIGDHPDDFQKLRDLVVVITST